MLIMVFNSLLECSCSLSVFVIYYHYSIYNMSFPEHRTRNIWRRIPMSQMLRSSSLVGLQTSADTAVF